MTDDQTQIILTVPAGQSIKYTLHSSTCYYSLKSVPSQFTFVIILLVPHPQLLRQLIINLLLIKPQQQLRCKTDAERQPCEVWQCLQALTTTRCSKDPISDMCCMQYCQFLQFIPTSCNT